MLAWSRLIQDSIAEEEYKEGMVVNRVKMQVRNYRLQFMR